MEKQPRAWAHLHLPRLRSGDTPNVISLKTPGWTIDYVSRVKLIDVEFKVHEAGRQRCIRENVRNVHAWVVGTVEFADHTDEWTYDFEGRYPEWRKAVYNPWEGPAFVDYSTLEPLTLAYAAILVGKDVWYQGYDTRYGQCTCGTQWAGDMPANHSVAVCAV